MSQQHLAAKIEKSIDEIIIFFEEPNLRINIERNNIKKAKDAIENLQAKKKKAISSICKQNDVNEKHITNIIRATLQNSIIDDEI